MIEKAKSWSWAVVGLYLSLGGATTGWAEPSTRPAIPSKKTNASPLGKSQKSAKQPLWSFDVRRLRGDIDVLPGAQWQTPQILDEEGQPVSFVVTGKAPRTVVLTEAQTMMVSGKISMRIPLRSQVQLRTLNGDIVVHPGTLRTDAYSLNGRLDVSGVLQWVRARTVSGDVQVTGSHDVQVSTISGDVRVQQVSGNVFINTVSGAVKVSDSLAARLTVRTTSGDLSLRQSQSQKISLHTFSGSVVIVGPVGPGAKVFAESASGECSVTGPLGRSAALVVRTASGDFRLRWPKTAGLSLQAQTNGSIRQPLPPPFSSRIGQLIQGKIGKPPYTRISFTGLSGDLIFGWK